MLKISRSAGEARTQYGKNSSLDGVEQLHRSYNTISAEHDWDKWFGSSSFSNNNYSENGPNYPEQIINVRYGRSFGSKTNQLGFFLGITQSNLYIPVRTNSATELEKVSFLSKGGGVRVISNLLSYELYYENYGEIEVESLNTTGKEVSHKVSLNLGKKIKYGLYYFSKTQDISGEYFCYRTSQGLGAYIGYKF